MASNTKSIRGCTAAGPDHAGTPRQQWRSLHTTLTNLGAKVELMTPQKGLPDLVFTANAGVMFQRRFFSSRFRHAERRLRDAALRRLVRGAWLLRRKRCRTAFYFEGAGDSLFSGATLFAGYRIRSDVNGHQWLGKVLQKQVLPVESVNPSFLSSRYVLLSAGARRGDLVSRCFRQIWP